MPQRRIVLIAAFVVVLGVVSIYHWMSGRDVITLDFDNVPAGKVVKAVERKAGIRIVTNGDLAAPITLHLRRASVYDAVDTLAVRMNGDLRIGYVGAPQERQINDALAAFSTNTNPGGWLAFALGGGWGGGQGGNRGGERAAAPPANGAPPAPAPGDQAGAGQRRGGGERRTAGGGGQGGGGGAGGMGGGFDFGSGDPRSIEWTISDMTDRNLQAFYNQGAQKTGAFFAVPSDWNPVLGGLPKSGKTRDMAKAIASAGKGRVQEVFLITVNARPTEVAQNEPRYTPTIFTPQRGPDRQNNPEWAGERLQAQIASLPPEERAQAQKDMDEMRAFRDSLKGLTDEERRAKWEEMMKRSDVQEKLEERQAARDAKNSPDQRDERARNYLQRKQASKGGL